MIFLQTIIENFFSIGPSIVWEMKDQGLVLISGENHDSTSADSNGAGKSTLFEALVWCLWGKTTRGQSGDAVVNRKTKKDCRVEVLIEHDGQVYGITRYRKHQTGRNGLEFVSFHNQETTDLTQGTTILTQSKIEGFLGIDYQTFIQGPMMPQGSFKKFSEMTDSEQKVVLEQALQIGVLAAALDETKERLADARQRLSAAEEGLRQTWLRYEGLVEDRDRYRAERDAWEGKKKQALACIAKELMAEVFEQEHFWEYSQAVNFQAAISEAKERTNALKQGKWDLETQSRDDTAEYQAMLVEAKSDLKQHQNEIRRLQGEIRELQTLGGECPTCQQTINEDHIDTCVAKLKGDLADAAVKLEAAREQVDKIESVMAEAREELDTKITAAAEELTSAEDKYLSLMTEAEAAKRWIDDLSAARRREAAVRLRFRQKQEEVSPYEKLLQDVEREILGCIADVQKLKSMVRGVRMEIEHLEFWKTGFSNKGLKSYILQSVTPFLNDRVTRYVQALTGGELEIEFSTQTTLKTGETRERFTVLVTNRNGAETYSGNSGGEKSRADLAINFTLSDLMSARARRPYRQRFLDEPFESLDESGIESVMELLAGMVVDAGSVFVVTHQDSMKGLFNKTIRLVKKDGQTRLAA